jgi:hypothetical protein
MVPNPHDTLFKVVFSQLEHARGMLQTVVPPALAALIDWSTLSLEPNSFVDAALRWQYTDLLFSAAWLDAGSSLVYFLFEHQSTLPDGGLMAFRLLRYQVQIWETWRADHKDAKALPPVVPIVMYHGSAPWSAPRAFAELLDAPAGRRSVVAPYTAQLSYMLHDLAEVSDDELRAAPRMTALGKLAVLCLKHARVRADFLEIFTGWMEVVREVARAPTGLKALAQVIRYILLVHQPGQRAPLEVLMALMEREVGSQAKEAIMTIGEQLIEQGVLQGRQEERQRFQGSLLRLLRQRFGNEVDAHVERRVAAGSGEQLEAWIARVLSAATLAELLAD